MRNLLTALLTSGALLGAVGTASAASTTTATFTVSATVLKTCSVAATNVGFPNYTPGSGPQTATSTISVNCTKGTTFTVALDKGTGGGTVAARLMAQGGGSGTLQYNLCTTPVLASGLCNGASAWGDGNLGTATQAGTGAGMGAGNAQSLTVNAGLPDSAANQGAAVAASGSSLYSDTVTVTVTY